MQRAFFRSLLGGLGYANFADEIKQQEKQIGIFFDTVVMATCTGQLRLEWSWGSGLRTARGG